MILLEKVHIVTCRPAYEDSWSLRKAFVTEELANKYIKEEETREGKLVGDTGVIADYDIDEIDLVTD